MSLFRPVRDEIIIFNTFFYRCFVPKGTGKPSTILLLNLECGDSKSHLLIY